MTKTASSPKLRLNELLRRRMLDLPGLTNAEIARALGLPRPNVVAMILRGRMKLPLTRLPALARVLEVDPVWLLRVTLDEYTPALWQVIEVVVGADALLSARERALIEFVRTHAGGADPDLLSAPTFREQLALHASGAMVSSKTG
ncbi:helix-turn-helix domain-containing protein [Inhella crocodyli]|uniref:XRE family transcriptional regulator n=1 Tax=Inhella crocodyli TaxID=2499851 RepID=A0A437LAJ9_9BURK|nr:helix-turn-helix transcriptional regulator [Inhella crocodyli]RVT82458.1 XRE family transcriptional regulator [Inhella crocodyli]